MAQWSRRRHLSRCGGGTALASEAEFEAHRDLADGMLDWYAQYVTILRRLRSGAVPTVFEGFCGGGGVREGVRRAHGAAVGMDLHEQPDYTRRFEGLAGHEFYLGDCTSWSAVGEVQRRHGLTMAMASPPCKSYSTALLRGTASEPPLIPIPRDLLSSLFRYWAIENVMGARKSMSAGAVVLDGAYFGLRVFRSRLFETNVPLHVDECVRAPADHLRVKCCLGERSKWRRDDEFGRHPLTACCAENVFAPLGKQSWRCTADECARAMGVDPGHMCYDRLA